jgi:hypothetical protein
MTSLRHDLLPFLLIFAQRTAEAADASGAGLGPQEARAGGRAPDTLVTLIQRETTDDE